MKNVLVIGGTGYVGSRLRQILTHSYNVDSVDCCWFNNDNDTYRIDYHNLTLEELSKYNVIVLVAGHSSVKTCSGNIQAPWLNNVTNFVNLLSKLSNDQLVIYASSASVYGNSLPGEYHREQIKNFAPINNYDLTKYTLDLQAMIAIAAGHNIIGLRFGTVNGWSPNLRTDVMINAMYDTAITQHKVTIANKKINRALLGIEDLCRGVAQCIEHPVAGIYNMASFNTTVEYIATTVAEKLSVPIIDNGDIANVYDFGLDTTLFQQTFSFTFIETPATILDSLIEKYTQSRTQRRDDYITYQWESNDGIN